MLSSCPWASTSLLIQQHSKSEAQHGGQPRRPQSLPNPRETIHNEQTPQGIDGRRREKESHGKKRNKSVTARVFQPRGTLASISIFFYGQPGKLPTPSWLPPETSILVIKFRGMDGILS